MRKIESGALREGDRLPSEEELAASHGVSVGTIQKALAKLCALRTRFAPARARNLCLGPQRCAGRRALSAVSRWGGQRPSLVRSRATRCGGSSAPARGRTFSAPTESVRIDRTINVGGRFDMYSEFWVREEDFAAPRRRQPPCAGSKPARAPGQATLAADATRRPVDSIRAAAARGGEAGWFRIPADPGIRDGTAGLHVARPAPVLPKRIRAAFRGAPGRRPIARQELPMTRFDPALLENWTAVDARRMRGARARRSRRQQGRRAQRVARLWHARHDPHRFVRRAVAVRAK